MVDKSCSRQPHESTGHEKGGMREGEVGREGAGLVVWPFGSLESAVAGKRLRGARLPD